MKTYVYLFILMIPVIFTSCGEPAIGFVTHQPKGVKPKPAINKDLIGEYVCIDTTICLIDFYETFPIANDSNTKWKVKNTFRIGENEIINKLQGELLVLKSSLDSSDKAKLLYFHDIDSTIIQNIKNPVYNYTLDSVDSWYKIDFSITSRLFKISKSNVYKEFKGKAYFNAVKSDSVSWSCTQFDYNPKSKELSINSISRDDICIIKRLTEVEQHIVIKEGSINPSKCTFKKFLRLNVFEDKIKLRKIGE
jgi:hypothetical protein